MKTNFRPIALSWSLFFCTCSLIAADVPDYRGKVVLIVAQDVAADTTVSAKIDRLTFDLVGDGWRVLRHDVGRGPFLYDPNFANNNAPLVREVRALIKADYDSASSEVQSVFLIGHVPVPYSGVDYGVSGGHYRGAGPSDTFYGEMVSGYGPGGWSDELTQQPPGYSAFDNLPNDGKFDQDTPPTPLKLGIGRVDVSKMNAFLAVVPEVTILSDYFDKDHDFRCRNFSVFARGLQVGDQSGSFNFCGPALFGTIFPGNQSPICDTTMHWFPNVKSVGQEYLMGFGGGFGGGAQATYLGATGPGMDGDPPLGSIQSAQNNFVDFASRVVFVNLYGSFFGSWDQPDNFLRAPLCNLYHTLAGGPSGYGLCVAWGAFGLDPLRLQNRALGTPTGQALFTGFTGGANYGLMGDPTLRLYNVAPATTLTAYPFNVAALVSLNWNASPDTSSYNIYRAPTSKGPYTLVNSGGPVTGTSYTADRPGVGEPPDNFYMVRAVYTQTTPWGNYLNMSEGVIAPLAEMFTPYLQINSQPKDQMLPNPAAGPIANAVAFSVDALGFDSSGEQLSYSWYRNGIQLVNDGHFTGVTTSALLIKGAQPSDAGNYYVVVRTGSQYALVVQSQPAVLAFNASPVANDDYFTAASVNSMDLDVLANDVDPDGPHAGLTITSVSPTTPMGSASVSINPDQRTVHVALTPGYTTVTFTYAVSDGFSARRATVTIDVPAALSGGHFNPQTDAFQFTGIGDPGSQWNVYSSDDLTQWQLRGTVLIGPGSADFTDSSVTGVAHRFYRLSNGVFCSQAIGFERWSVNAASWLVIPYQLDTGCSLIGGLFADGTFLTPGTQVYVGDDPTAYVWNGSDFSNGGGDVIPALGDEIGFYNPANYAESIVIVGYVPEGDLVHNVTLEMGSMIPRGGGITSLLGYSPSSWDEVLLWANGDYTGDYMYMNNQWKNVSTGQPEEPVVQIGQAVSIYTDQIKDWHQHYQRTCP